jgi:predicted MFS family arabinose efflux permease
MLGFVRRNPQLRTVILVVAAINLLFNGPLIVGTATLGRVRFVEGSAAFGAMLSAFGVGMLTGTLAAGVIRPRRPGLVCLLLVAAEGVFLVGVAHAAALATACVLLVLIGVGAGFGNVNVVTLTQKNVSKAMMGRVMSLIVLAEVGLTPVSNALAGVLADWSVTLMFVLAGGLLTLTTLLALLVPEVRAIEE